MRRGTYRYARKAFYHAYDNNERNKQLNKNYKALIKSSAIEQLRNMDNFNDKINYINELKFNTYRYGRKYKYDCNFNNREIAEIACVGDEKLKELYPTPEYSEGCLGVMIFIIAIFIIIVLINL